MTGPTWETEVEVVFLNPHELRTILYLYNLVDVISLETSSEDIIIFTKKWFILSEIVFKWEQQCIQCN